MSIASLRMHDLITDVGTPTASMWHIRSTNPDNDVVVIFARDGTRKVISRERYEVIMSAPSAEECERLVQQYGEVPDEWWENDDHAIEY